LVVSPPPFAFFICLSSCPAHFAVLVRQILHMCSFCQAFVGRDLHQALGRARKARDQTANEDRLVVADDGPRRVTTSL